MARWRSGFMVVSGVAHLLAGVWFLLASDTTVQHLVIDPPPRSVLLVRGLGGILVAFGAMNLMAFRAADGTALRAILLGTLLFLACTAAFDVHWALQGLLLPAAWGTIAVRALLVAGYGVLLCARRG